MVIYENNSKIILIFKLFFIVKSIIYLILIKNYIFKNIKSIYNI